jgi:DnaK suppressor protein
MNKKDLAVVEKKLLQQRAHLVEEIGRLDATLANNIKEASGDLSSYSFHMADLGSDAFEREMSYLRSSTEGALLFDTIDALRRLYRGEFGNCESCGGKIARDRLLALPQARLCIACQAAHERRVLR